MTRAFRTEEADKMAAITRAGRCDKMHGNVMVWVRILVGMKVQPMCPVDHLQVSLNKGIRTKVKRRTPQTQQEEPGPEYVIRDALRPLLRIWILVFAVFVRIPIDVVTLHKDIL